MMAWSNILGRTSKLDRDIEKCAGKLRKAERLRMKHAKLELDLKNELIDLKRKKSEE